MNQTILQPIVVPPGWEAASESMPYSLASSSTPSILPYDGHIFALLTPASNDCSLWMLEDDGTWSAVSQSVYRINYGYASMFEHDGDLYVTTSGYLYRWNGLQSLSVMAYPPSSMPHSLAYQDFVGPLKGAIYLNHCGYVYKFEDSIWTLLAQPYAGGLQMWENYPDSPYTKAQFPKQVIYYFGNDEFPGDYTYLAITNNSNDQYGPRNSETVLGGGIFAATTTLIYMLINGAWVYYQNRYNGQYLMLLGPLLPSPSVQYIKECNYNVRDYSNPNITAKAKTTTLAQDNLADASYWSNMAIDENDDIYIIDLNTDVIKRWSIGDTTQWTNVGTISTYVGDLVTRPEGAFTTYYGYDGTETYKIIDNAFTAINDISFGEYFFEAFGSTCTINGGVLYTDIFTSSPTAYDISFPSYYFDSRLVVVYQGGLGFILADNILYQFTKTNYNMLVGSPELDNNGDQLLMNLCSIGTDLYMYSEQSDILYVRHQSATSKLTRINT